MTDHNPEIELKSSPTIVKRYRQLLIRDSDASSVNDIMQYLFAMYAGSTDQRCRSILNPTELPEDGFNNAARASAWYMMLIAPPERFPKLQMSTADHMPGTVGFAAWKATTWLTLQGWGRPSGAIDLMRSGQSLLVLACLSELLPALKKAASGTHSILLHAVRFNIMLVQSDDAAHGQYLQSLLYEYLRWKDQKMACLLNAFRLTPPSDHSYLTKAQDYWSCLLDEKRIADADQFLFELYKNAPSECHTEIAAMRRLTVVGRKKAVAS